MTHPTDRGMWITLGVVVAYIFAVAWIIWKVVQ